MEVFKLMILFGIFSFFSFGICVANSIEAKDNNRMANFLTVMTVLGLISAIVGIVGYLITN